MDFNKEKVDVGVVDSPPSCGLDKMCLFLPSPSRLVCLDSIHNRSLSPTLCVAAAPQKTTLPWRLLWWFDKCKRKEAELALSEA